MPDQENRINPNIEIPKKSEEETKLSKEKFTSKITESIGRGEDAKNSFVYLVLRYAFIAGCVISLAVAINHWCFRCKEKVPDFMEDIKLTWDIFVPLITLALGYAFGKSRD